MTKAMRIIIPFKGAKANSAGQAKGRLANCLDVDARNALSAAMLKNLVLSFDQFAEQNPKVIESIVVVSKDGACTAGIKPKSLALHWLKEPESIQGLNPSLDFALDHAEQAGIKQCLIVHADLPLVSFDDVAVLMNDASLAQSNKKVSDIHLLQDKSKSGTNGLVLPLPNPLSLSFGENSCSKHVQQALLSGLKLHVFQQAHWAFDLDDEDDLQRLIAYDFAPDHCVAQCLATLELNKLKPRRA